MRSKRHDCIFLLLLLSVKKHNSFNESMELIVSKISQVLWSTLTIQSHSQVPSSICCFVHTLESLGSSEQSIASLPCHRLILVKTLKLKSMERMLAKVPAIKMKQHKSWVEPGNEARHCTVSTVNIAVYNVIICIRCC